MTITNRRTAVTTKQQDRERRYDDPLWVEAPGLAGISPDALDNGLWVRPEDEYFDNGVPPQRRIYRAAFEDFRRRWLESERWQDLVKTTTEQRRREHGEAMNEGARAKASEAYHALIASRAQQVRALQGGRVTGTISTDPETAGMAREAAADAAREYRAEYLRRHPEPTIQQVEKELREAEK